MMSCYVEVTKDFPYGDTCGLVGVDQFIVKSGTITIFRQARAFKQITFSVSLVVRVTAQYQTLTYSPKLVED